MNWYVVTHPGIDQDAKVEAPTSSKARTTFLDYLERSGIVSRKNRQALRKGMAVKLLRDEGDVDTPVTLYYTGSYEEVPTIPLSEEVEGSEILKEVPVSEEVSLEQQNLSPIAQVTLRSVLR